jgi:phospholipid/cholesterol/gamma-HCH transport system substrate-binding protein
MNPRRLELTVGAFVLCGLLAVAYLALRIGAGALIGTDTYVVSARFANVAGLNPGAKVSISGVTVGKVDTVRLNSDDYSAIVDLRLRRDIRLPSDSIVSVKTSGLIGDKFLAVQPGADDETVPPGGMLTETESTVDIESLVSRMAFGGVKGKED